jgi:hypothetical protein
LRCAWLCRVAVAVECSRDISAVSDGTTPAARKREARLNPAQRISPTKATLLVALALLACQSLASCSGPTDGSASGQSGASAAGFPQPDAAGQGGGGGTVAGSSGSDASGAGGRAGSTGGRHSSGTGGGGGSVCLSNQIVIYTAPGCGTAAVPVCSDGSGGACASTVCGCDGQVRRDRCYSSTAPFAYFEKGGPSGATCDPDSMGGQSGQGGSGGG